METLIRPSGQKAILDLAGVVEFWPEVEEGRSAARTGRRQRLA